MLLHIKNNYIIFKLACIVKRTKVKILVDFMLILVYTGIM